MKMQSTLLACGFLLLSFPLFSQEEKEEKSAAELAKELANPNATMGQMLFPIDYVMYNGDLNDAGGQSGAIISFQPSLPVKLSEGLNFYARPLIPVFITQPVITSSGFEQKGGLGNISADIAVGKTWPSKWITLAGAFGGFPTASDEALKSSQVTLGPELLVAKLTSFGVLGIMVSHAWGVGNPNDPDAASTSLQPDDFWITANDPQSASVTAGQYFYTINLKKGWQITASPTYSYNHNGSDGNQFTFPIGTGAQKVLKAGKTPFRLGLQYWYYVASPDAFGPEHQVRLTIAPVVPLPW